MVRVVGRDGQQWNLRLLERYVPPTVTWKKLVGLLWPNVMDNPGTEVVENERDWDVGVEDHHYPAMDRRPPDRYMPEDFRQKKAQSKGAKGQDSH